MTADVIEIAWVVIWAMTFLALLPMEHWAWLTMQDHRQQRRTTALNGYMSAMADWFLALFRLLGLAAFLMTVVAIPGLLLPAPPPRPPLDLTGWQGTVQAIAGPVVLVGLFGAATAMLGVGVCSLVMLRRLSSHTITHKGETQ